MKLFEFDIHIGDWRVLIQDRDIQNGAIQSRHISSGAVTTDKIGDGEVKAQHIAPEAVTTDKIGDKEVQARHIAPEAVTNEKIADNAITGDEIEGNTVKYGKIDNDAVQARNIKDRNVTSSKIAKKNILLEHFAPDVLPTLKQDLQNQIDALEIAGVAVSNEFGTDPHIAISQITMTNAINKIWQKIEDITGEILQGINMIVTPTFFVSENGCDVHISANTVDTNGIFEKIQFFVDNQLIHEETFAEYVSFDHHLDIKPEYDYVFMCKAKIMGVEYTRQQIITRYNEFYIGAGTTYSDIMDSAHARQLNGTMRHNYDLSFADDDKLIIMMGASLRDGFIRADLNGVEIQLTEETVTIDGKDYVVFSSDSWSAGEYNIDING